MSFIDESSRSATVIRWSSKVGLHMVLSRGLLSPSRAWRIARTPIINNTTILYDDRVTKGVNARVDGSHPWLAPADMAAATG